MTGKKLKTIFKIGSNGSDLLALELGKKLKQQLAKDGYDLEVYYAGAMQRFKDNLIAKGVAPDKIFLTGHEEIKKPAQPDLKYLRRCEKLYGIRVWDRWTISAPRRNYSKTSPDEILYWFEYTFRAYEKLFDQVQPDFIITYFPGNFNMSIYTEMAKGRNIPVLYPHGSRLPKRFMIDQGLSGLNENLMAEYEQIKKEGLSESERKRALEYISSFHNRPKTQDCKVKFKESFSEKVKKGREDITFALQLLFKYRQFSSFYYLMQRGKNKVKEKYYLTKKYFEYPPPGEKFVLFPLHVQPEMATSLFGKWYTNQLNLAEIISKALPVDYKLYIKEHNYFGSRPNGFYQELKKLKNCRLIHPRVNNFKLIQKSSLVMTITGTAGFEAFFFGKPVITFGNIFYNSFDGVKKIEDVEKLPELIESQLNQKIDPEKAIEFLGAMFRITYPGLMLLPRRTKGESLSSDNTTLLAAGLYDHLKKNKIIS